jgi:hypothetical protein
MEGLFESFKVGAQGWFITWLLLCDAAFMIALLIERVYFIKIRICTDPEIFMNKILLFVTEKEYKNAIDFCDGIKALPYIVKQGLLGAEADGYDGAKKMTDVARLMIVPKIKDRVIFFNACAIVGLLLGLIGIAYGLLLACNSLTDPVIHSSQTYGLFAKSLYPLLFGLSIATVSSLVYFILKNEVEKIISSIDEHTARMLLIFKNTKKGE